MATGDVTAIEILASGQQVKITLEGMTAGNISGFVEGKAATLNCVSYGYVGTSLEDDRNRTGIRTAFNSAADNAGDAEVTLDLEEPIHDDDDTVTIDLDAGAFDDGTVTSAAVSGGAVTNNSTLDYAITVCNIVSEVLTRETGEFYVDVYGCAGAYRGYRSQFGIAAVEVQICEPITTAASPGTFTDGETLTGGTSGATATLIAQSGTTLWIENLSGSWSASETITGGTSAATATYSSGGRAVTKTATEMSLIDKIGDYGWQDKWQAFRVGPFDPADWDGEGNPASNSIVPVTARAYPKIGDADSVRQARTEFVFLDHDNSYDMRHAVVDPSNGSDSTGRTAVGDGGWYEGVDNVSALCTSNPHQTIHAAISRCQRGDGTTPPAGSGRASFSVIYLVEGNHVLGTYSFGARSDTSDGPVILTRLPSAAKDAVKIVGSADSAGVRTSALKFDDFTIDLGASGQLNTGAPAISGRPLGTDNYLLIRNCEWVGPGRGQPMSINPVVGFERTYRYGGTAKDMDVPVGGHVSRDMLWTNCSGDAHVVLNSSNMSMCNNVYEHFDPDGTDTHVDIVQISGAQNAVNSNIGYHNCLIRDIRETQAPVFGNAGGNTNTVTSFAMTFVVSENDGENTLSQLTDLVMNSVFFYHNSCADGMIYRENNDLFVQNNFWATRNYYSSLGTQNSPATVATGHVNNHNASGAFVKGFDWTTGGSTATQFNDFDTTYRPATTGDLVNRWDDPLAPYDAAGDEMPTDGSGAIGALQLASGPDEDAPILSTAAINAAGDTLTLTFSDASPPMQGTTGFTLSGGHSLSNGQIDGLDITFDVSPTVYDDEVLTVSYSPGNVTDSAETPNALEAFSDESVTNNSTQERPPLAAGTLSLVAKSHSRITVNYSAPTGGEAPYEHELQISTDGGESWSPVRQIAAGVNEAITGLTPETAYQVRVVTTDAAEASNTSNVLEVTTNAAPEAADGTGNGLGISLGLGI